MTVAAGTMYGLILYANIIGADMIFAFLKNSTTQLKVSWIELAMMA